MDANYANRYRDLYLQHWWWRARERAILRQMESMGFQRDGSQRILDVGCGDGLFFDQLEPFGEVRGIETDATTFTGDGKWRQQIENRPFNNQYQPGVQFDLVMMLDLLEHLEDPEAALSHARRLLKPNGKLLITVPAFPILWTTHDDLNHHFIRYTRRTLASLADRSGVQFNEMKYFYHWTCPIKLLIRWKENWFGSKAAPPRVPNRLVNGICLALSRLEQHTISRWGMPFGSSLMATGGAQA